MAKRKGAAVEATVDDDAPLLVDGAGAESTPDAVLVEEPKTSAGDERPGTGGQQDQPSGDGKPAKDLEAENANLKRALKEQRRSDRIRRDRLVTELESERNARNAADRRAAEAAELKKADAKLASLEEVEDLRHAVPIIRDHIDETLIQPSIANIRTQQLRMSQKMARRDHDDYDAVLKESGVEDAIALDASGKPKDPVLWRKIILNSDDPAEDAYQLGLAELERQGKRPPAAEPDPDDDTDILDEPAGDRAAGRRDVVERLEQIGRRPMGIRTLTGQRGSESTTRLTRKRIDAMSEEEYAKLPASVREQYLMGTP
ncbi:MAG TPA: hypothetical protein DCQ64_18590 [Candidatus Rokubacteria bacterium]|nr:hypothetical protein [Candidatus Rokubacteria bacterium]